MDDRDLLQAYVQGQSDQAFAELVARHVDRVYATALRLLREPQAAQDVVQVVFIQLARKAWTVRRGGALSGWLYRATYHAALNAQYREDRRRRREAEAVNLAETEAVPGAWEKLAPILDEALQALNRKEQDAVMLRYFEGRSVRETGTALAITEEAAQKRLGRAVEKLRAHFAREGVPVSSVALTAILAAPRAEAAPAGLAGAVTERSLAALSASGLGGTLLFFMSTQTKVILGATLAIAVIVAIIVIRQPGTPAAMAPISPPRAGVPVPAAPQVPALPASQPASPPVPAAVPAGNVSVPPATPAAVEKPAVSTTTEARKELNTAIDEAIRLLEAQEYVAFIKEYLPPDKRTNLPPGVDFDTFAERMGNSPRNLRELTITLESIKAAQNQTPNMDADGATATFSYIDPEGRSSNVRFMKVDGLWYFGF